MATNQANYQIGLQFNADIAQAKRELQNLQKEFDKLNQTNTGLHIDNNLKQAKLEAQELVQIFNSSVNLDGTFNLSKFTKNLNASGKQLDQYKASFDKLGEAGTNSFDGICKSILNAKTPLTELNGLMGALWTSFKQTAKYQFTSSIYRNLIGGLRDAYSYAQELNESLNNIRIVTGQSTDQMAKFAEEANKAAKQLSVTTTQYTNGALIYYQQGLNDEEVKARTDVTMKLANASGVSAETASQQLTAIWNNFAKGSENLEYFADVMTALGASTASSTSEIAEGLEKFAAIGNTVGLSYEYAASALATVTATTRQSADVVGTAFKTLFARIQDLEVGETLEDGTTLGKYSQALASVGVNIKDANGELKAMDQILEEMAAAWSTISKDQQVALAQTVAGTRQYTQLVALMENWSFMQKNLQTSYDSTGTVQKQADIYAESWEAAKNRVTAAAQDIYKSLIDDKFFIELTDIFAKLLDHLDNFIDGLGGIKTLLPMIGALFTQIFQKQISSSFSNIAQVTSDLFKISDKQNAATRQQAINAKYGGYEEETGYSGETITLLGQMRSKELELSEDLKNNYAKMSDQERKFKQNQLEIIEKEIQKAELINKENEALDEQIAKLTSLKDIGWTTLDKNNFSKFSQTQGDWLNTASEKFGTKGYSKTAVLEHTNAILNTEFMPEEIRNKITNQVGTGIQDLLSAKNIDKNAVKEALQELSNLLKEIDVNAIKSGQSLNGVIQSTIVKNKNALSKTGNLLGELLGFEDEINSGDKQKISAFLNHIKKEIEESPVLNEMGQDITDAITNFNFNTATDKKFQEFFNGIKTKMKELDASQLDILEQAYDELTKKYNVNTEEAKKNAQQLHDTAVAQGKLNQQVKNGSVVIDDTTEKYKKYKNTVVTTSEALTSISSSVMALSSMLNIFDNFGSVLNDKDKTGKDIFNTILSSASSLLFLVPQFLKGFGTLSKTLKTVPAIGTLAAKGLQAVGLSTQSAAAIASGASVTFGQLLLTLLPYIAVLGILAGGIVLVSNKLNEDSIAAEQASKRAKELTKNYNELNEETKKFNDTLSNYENAINGLEKLTAGTDEYKKKVEEANEEAKKLIEENEALKNNYKYNSSTGLIEIDKEALESTKDEKEQKVINLQATSVYAQNQSNNKELISQITDIVRSNKTDYSNEEERKALEELKHSFEIYGDKQLAIANLEPKYGKIISAIKESDVSSYLTKIQNNQNYNLNASKEIGDRVLSFNKDYLELNPPKKEVVSAIVGSKIQTETIKNSSGLLLDFFDTYGENKTFGGIKTDAANRTQLIGAKEIQDKLKELKSDATYTIHDFNKDFVSTLFSKSVYDKEGLEETTAYQLLLEAANKFYDSSEVYKESLNEITTIEDYLKDYFPSTSEDNFDIFLSKWANGTTGDLSNFTGKDISQLPSLLESNEFNQIAELLNWNPEILKKSLNQQIEIINDEFNKIESGLAIQAKEKLFEVAKDNAGNFIYTLTDTQSLKKIFSDTFVSGGTEGVNKLAELLKGQKDPVGIMTALEGTDWKNADIDELYKKLIELGHAVDYSVFKEFAQGLKTSAHEAYLLTASLEDLIKNYKELKDLLGKVQYGSVISDEEYQKLIKSRDDLKGKFIYTVDGWIYIGDTDDLNTSKSLDINELKKRNKQGQEDVASANLYDFSKSRNSDKEYFEAARSFTSAGAEGAESNFGFNETAAAMAGIINEEGLKDALAKYFDDTDKLAQESAQKIVKAYVNALVTLQGLGAKFDDESTFTLALKEQYKTVDDLINHWDEVVEDFQDDAEKYKEAGYEVVLTNELASKGIDVKKYEAYYKYLQRINPELEYNITLARQLALANLNVQKGLESLNANFDSYIEGLTEAVGSPAHEQALTAIRQDLADILSVQVEDLNNVDEAFIAEHQDLIKLASQGNEDALLQLELFAAQVVGELNEETMEVVKQLQEAVNNTEIGAIVHVDADVSGIPQPIRDMLGIETDKEGNMRSQGRWTQRANLQTLQNKSADKAGKSKTLKSIDDEIDRYHYIRKLLADIERELDRVDKAKERAYGAQHLKYIEQETDYLREQVGLQDRYINEIEGYLAKDRGLIAAYGAQFDQFGNISNYNQLFTSNFNKYANAEDSTNWENFKKALSKYEETLDLWFEQTEEKAELLRQILDKQLEGISYKVEVEVALDDREIALLEHQLDRLDDAAYDTAAALANIGEQFKNTEDSIKSTTNGIVDVLKTIPGITQDQINRYLAGDGDALAGLHIEQGQIELLEQYSDQLLELSDRLKELHDSALQKVTEAFDAWGEKIEDHVAKFEHLNNVLNNYEEIIGILGRNNLGISNEFMRAMRNQEITNLQSILDTRTQTKDVLTAQLADARQKASKAATEAEREDWEQIITDLEGRLREATESWQQAWIDALQANKEAFEQTMQELVDSFDDYADELKRYDTAEDRYLETYRQAYELSKLGRDIQNSINDQDSIRAKKELQKLEDKINALKESGRAISENELGLLQKEYELRLAEIALEDAQNAKSLVRLERDNEGNWGYVYTADQENIEKARQDYEDKLYEYMRLADTMAEEASRAILTLNKEMAEALAALDTDAEDYEAKVAEITQFYADQINYFAEQYGISVDAITNVARESAAKYKPEVVDIIDSDNSGLQTNFAETVLAIIGDFEDLEDAIAGPDGALPNIQRAYTETLTAFESYREQNAETCRLAGVDVNNMAEEMGKAFKNIERESKTVRDSTKDLTEDMKTYLSTTLNSFDDFGRKYSEKVNSINKANELLANSLITLQKNLNDFSDNSVKRLQKVRDEVAATAQALKLVGAGGEGKGTIDIPKTSSAEKDSDENLKLSHAGVGGDGFLFVDSAGNYYTADNYNGVNAHKYSFYNTPIGQNNLEYIKKTKFAEFGYRVGDWLEWFKTLESEELKAEVASWLKSIGIPIKFATGGYTGEWGSSGRLALLHEKELVLNKEDTANILDAVSLIRQMTAGTAQLSYGLGNIGAGLANLNLSPGTMDQNVNISASFPNVVNHNEIEEALTNLVNKASQYAFRPNLT